jgi:hypothetical protein
MSAAILQSIIAVRQGLESEIDVETTFSVGVLMDLVTCKIPLKSVGFLYGFHPPPGPFESQKTLRQTHTLLWISHLWIRKSRPETSWHVVC